jgi:hypothetical protein
MELSEEGKREWDRITPLEAMGRADGRSIARGWRLLRMLVPLGGSGEDAPRIRAGDEDTEGVPDAEPILKNCQPGMDHMPKFMVEFGLTPSSRSRVQVDLLKKASEDQPARTRLACPPQLSWPARPIPKGPNQSAVHRRAASGCRQMDEAGMQSASRGPERAKAS